MAQLSMRIEDDLRDAFAKLADENKLSQPQMFAKMMEVIGKEELKHAVPDAATELDEVEAAVHKVLDLHRAAVQRANDAYEIARDKVRQELDQLAATVKENQELRETDKALREQLAAVTQERDEATKALEADVEAAKAEAGRISQELAEAQKKAAEALAEAQARAAEADDLKRQLTEAREQILSLREQHAAELEKVRAEGFAQIIEYVKAQQSKPSGASK